jgi:hypothetical protein
MAALRETAARQLLAVALYFTRQHAIRLNVSNPGVRMKRKRDTVAGKKGSSYTVYSSPSLPGQYPRSRTGALRRGQRYSPDDKAGVIANNMTVRVGMLANVFYGIALELRQGRLGLVKTLQDLRPLLAEIVKRTVKKTR